MKWYGHSAFEIDLPSGKTILVDPWITNPTNPNGKEDVKNVKADLILVTHGHFDHVGDAAEIAKRTRAHLVATFDLGNAIVGTMGYPKDLYGFDTGGNFGGSIDVLGGEATITFVPAVHSSGIGTDPRHEQYGGNPGGFVIAVKGGPTIYHTGDTDLFGDMALIGSHFKIDLMLVVHRRSLHDGSGSRRRGREARPREGGRADALRDISGADRHGRRIRQGAQEDLAGHEARRDEGRRVDHAVSSRACCRSPLRAGCSCCTPASASRRSRPARTS